MCTALSRARGVLFLLRSFPLFAYVRTPSHLSHYTSHSCRHQTVFGSRHFGEELFVTPSVLAGKPAVAAEFLLPAAAGTITRPLHT